VYLTHVCTGLCLLCNGEARTFHPNGGSVPERIPPDRLRSQLQRPHHDVQVGRVIATASGSVTRFGSRRRSVFVMNDIFYVRMCGIAPVKTLHISAVSTGLSACVPLMRPRLCRSTSAPDGSASTAAARAVRFCLPSDSRRGKVALGGVTCPARSSRCSGPAPGWVVTWCCTRLPMCGSYRIQAVPPTLWQCWAGSRTAQR